MKKNNTNPIANVDQNALQQTTKPNDNTKYIAHAVEIYNLPPIEIANGDEVAERIGEYFSICAKNGMKPNIAGIASSLGISRQYLWEIANNKTNVSQKVVYTVKKAQQMMNQMMEDYMMDGKVNVVAGIFLMKNNMNYKDQQEVVLSPNIPEKNNDDLINESKFLADKVEK